MASKLNAPRFGAWAAVIAMGLFVLAPQAALFLYSFVSRDTGQLTLGGVQSLLDARGFGEALAMSLIIAVAVVVILILVLVPALVAVHLWAPKLKGLLNILCTLPLVIPTIALVAGLMSSLRVLASGGRGSVGNTISQFMQNGDLPLVLIGSYVVLSLPFTYRSINAGLEDIPLKVYFEASESLGGSVWHTIQKVVIPNIRGSVIFSAFFAFSLSLGEYTMAATMGYATLPVWMTILSTSDFRASITLSLLLNIFTWVTLALAMIYSDRFSSARTRARKSKKTQNTITPAAPAPVSVKEGSVSS